MRILPAFGYYLIFCWDGDVLTLFVPQSLPLEGGKERSFKSAVDVVQLRLISDISGFIRCLIKTYDFVLEASGVFVFVEVGGD